MGIEEVFSEPRYAVVCDNCGSRDDNDMRCYVSEEEATEMVREIGWLVDLEGTFCPECRR